jgi:hypothetical protein
MNVERRRVLRSLLSFTRNASELPPPAVACAAPAVTGKFAEPVTPVTYTSPAAFSANE